MPSLQDVRPPFVVFETRPEEDREASLEKGMYVARNVDYAIVTPAGSKDRIVREVQSWFTLLQENVLSERIPGTWLEYYKAKYKAWKSSEELPESGTPLKTWPPISPAALQTLLRMGINTVEGLAEAPETALNALGMGARELKRNAQSWLSSNSAQTQQLAQLEKANKELMARLAAMEEALNAKKPETPKVEGADLVQALDDLIPKKA